MHFSVLAGLVNIALDSQKKSPMQFFFLFSSIQTQPMGAFGSGICVCICVFLFFFYFFFPCVLGQILLLRLLFMHCAWTVATKFDLSNNFHPISAHCTLFTDPQISLFSNFFIKNRSHGTIHIFKNYFATVFFSFNFQFSTVSKRTLYWYL